MVCLLERVLLPKAIFEALAFIGLIATATLMPAARKSSKPSKPASGGVNRVGKNEKLASGNKQPSNMLASGNTKAVIEKKKKKNLHVESNEMDERRKKTTMVVGAKEATAKKKKPIEVETKETNVKEMKKEVETEVTKTVTKKKNSLAAGSDSSATKRNKVTLKIKRDPSSDDTSSESYSYYDSSLASGSEDEPRDKPNFVDKPAKQHQPAEEEEIDWGGDSESTYSETSEAEADEPATGGIPITGDLIGDVTGDVSDMLATGGMESVRLTPAAGEGNDFDEDEKDDGWTWQQWQPWKKARSESYSGHWQKSSSAYSGHWQKSSSWHESWQEAWQQKSAWTWRSRRQYDASDSYESEGHSSESLLAPGSMRPQLADALSRWPAFPSSSLMKEDGLKDFASRAILQVKNLQENPPDDVQEWALLTALPLDRPASGGVGYMSIKDVVNLHRGEVRELGGGGWAACDSKSEEFAAKNAQLKGLIVKPASGGAAKVRVSKVFSVMDLFMAMGKMYSAKELYDAYLSCDIIARRRTRSKKQ